MTNPMTATAMWDNGRVRSMDRGCTQQPSIRDEMRACHTPIARRSPVPVTG
jgi:hypothetical protein